MKIKNIYIKKEKALKDIEKCFEKNNKIYIKRKKRGEIML